MLVVRYLLVRVERTVKCNCVHKFVRLSEATSDETFEGAGQFSM
jgi:hypothetical protein